MSEHDTVEHHLQLLVGDHEDEDDLLIANREFGRIFVKDSSQVRKPVVELNDIAVILKLHDVGEVNFNASMILEDCRAVQISLTVISI